MSNRKLKANQNLKKQTWKLSNTVFKQLTNWFLRSLLVMGRRSRLSRSGFVLPTVIIMGLVIVLLTTAILLRSFDRSKNASNVRVNQAVLNAAAPAIDRARAKLDALFSDPLLPRGTPTSFALNNALSTGRYTLGDEHRLKLAQEFNNQTGIQANTPAVEDDETSTTAWRFPVDTDNNGKFDSYTLYSIYFRSPTTDANGKFTRARNFLEARSAPMNGGTLGGQCANATGTSASLVGKSDWYKTGAQLTKSFFVYTTTVPIATPPNSPAVGSASQYESYTGNKSFSALEFEQDRVRIPLNNNAAWYEDDIEVSNTTTVRLNGRLFTNSNLMIAGNGSTQPTILYQVSDPNSCYYEQENSKVVIGGNIANGDVSSTTDVGYVEVHRYQGKGTAPTGQTTSEGINNTNKTTNQAGGKLVGYNNNAYSARIGLMVQAALALHPPITPANLPTIASVNGVARYPQEVKDRFKQRVNDPNETKKADQILTEEIQTYFKNHTRRVPYAEVDSAAVSGTALGTYTADNVFGSTSPIRPPDTWMAIQDPTSGSTTSYTNLPLKFGNSTMFLPATEPTKQQKDDKENLIGDRILVGNNLPYLWPKYKTDGTGTFDKFAEQGNEQLVTNGNTAVNWDLSNATNTQRTRKSQVQYLPDLGSIGRDGFWETQASQKPAATENTGGLRVVTGAGVYIDGVASLSGGTGTRVPATGAKSFLPTPALNSGIIDPPKFSTATFPSANENNDNIVVSPDLMPMWDGSSMKGDLQMRATAVYHYTTSTADPGKVDPNQVPIACVSSYYDPSNNTTARNQSGSPDVSGIYDTDGNGTYDTLADGSTPSPAVNSNSGQSNNGVTYNSPYIDDIGRTLAVTAYRDKLNKQARSIFPTGRIVNAPLRQALTNIDATKARSLADNAAIDTAICALKILDPISPLTVQTSPNIPHGAIKEAAFLDARQVKSLNNNVNTDGSLDNTKIAETKTATTNQYTLPLEQRQPLEIRVTDLDLNLLRAKTIGTPTDTSNSSTNNQEYLLPNSGIIYATRDDALPDLSDNTLLSDGSSDNNTQALVSPTDFKLDSTRRPNGIRLVNGSNLARNNSYRVAEKGLILATNLPTYIKGDFNLHKDPSSSTAREEFTSTLNTDWSNFYTRSQNGGSLDPNFACRQNQTGCGGSGDQWRTATIISDAQTLLSNQFWDGFRNEGDYDLSNNQGNSAASSRLKQGFWNNNFVTSANWDNSSGYPNNYYSYLTNGVTPIQRQVNNFPEYIMEVCPILPVSECKPKNLPANNKPTDWVVGYDINGNGTLDDSVTFDVGSDGDTSNDKEKFIKADQLGQALVASGKTDGGDGILINTEVNWSTPYGTTNKSPLDRLGAGTTARLALLTADQRYARRVAFARRNQFDTLVFTSIGTGTSTKYAAKPLGVGCPLDTSSTKPENSGCQYPSTSSWAAGTHYGNPANNTNALWFRTTTNIVGNPGDLATGSYNTNFPLYYSSPNPVVDTKVMLPNTPDIQGATGLITLNGTGTTDPSDFTMCLTGSGTGEHPTFYSSDSKASIQVSTTMS